MDYKFSGVTYSTKVPILWFLPFSPNPFLKLINSLICLFRYKWMLYEDKPFQNRCPKFSILRTFQYFTYLHTHSHQYIYIHMSSLSRLPLPYSSLKLFFPPPYIFSGVLAYIYIRNMEKRNDVCWARWRSRARALPTHDLLSSVPLSYFLFF